MRLPKISSGVKIFIFWIAILVLLVFLKIFVFKW